MDEASESLNYEKTAYFKHDCFHSGSLSPDNPQQILQRLAIGSSSLGITRVVVILHAKDGVVTRPNVIVRVEMFPSRSSRSIRTLYLETQNPSSSTIGEATQIWLKGRRGGAFEARVPLRGTCPSSG